jgi:F0F1-type ATP synthase membrane subunit b/b'
MKPVRRLLSVIVGWLLLIVAATPLLAAEESSPEPADTLAGTLFRWLNFALVFGAFAYVLSKFGAPYFRNRAQDIFRSIQDAREARDAAKRELHEATEKLSAVGLEIQDMHRAAAQDSAAEGERIRALALNETQKIAQAARGEIAAAERAGRQEVRAIAARLATERAARLLHEQINVAVESVLFRSFVRELERTAP